MTLAVIRATAAIGMVFTIAVVLAVIPVPLNLVVAWFFWHYTWEMIEQLS